jgi:hypothetical protein
MIVFQVQIQLWLDSWWSLLSGLIISRTPVPLIVAIGLNLVLVTEVDVILP